ncbi:MAG: hypothetical protein RMM30_09555 [Armatimonadota bacterium]|nr:hypothetical protein [Armatimonadota bacterium]MDW8156815.1 hypothetical protein [Armatimonadota bacterium]
MLAEHGVETLLREALILPIREGIPRRQVLDGLEAMLHTGAHHALLDELAQLDFPGPEALRRRVQAHLELPPDAREAQAEELFAELARFTADRLSRR